GLSGRGLRDPPARLRGRHRGRPRQPQGRVPRRPPRRPARQLRQGALSPARTVHDLRAHGDHPGRPSVGTLRRPMRAAVGAAAVALLALLPLALSSYQLGLLTKMLIFALFAMSLNLILGYAGLPSLGHAAYFAVGAN